MSGRESGRKRAASGSPERGADASSPSVPTPSLPPASGAVTLNIGGTIFKSSASTLSSSSEYFSRLFSGMWTTGDELFLDRDAAPFEILLTFMRSGLIELCENDTSLWRRTVREADFFGMDGFLTAVKARTHRNGLSPSWAGTDAEAAAAFDAEHGSVEAALEEGVLPQRFFRRSGSPPLSCSGHLPNSPLFRSPSHLSSSSDRLLL